MLTAFSIDGQYPLRKGQPEFDTILMMRLHIFESFHRVSRDCNSFLFSRTLFLIFLNFHSFSRIFRAIPSSLMIMSTTVNFVIHVFLFLFFCLLVIFQSFDIYLVFFFLFQFFPPTCWNKDIFFGFLFLSI